MSDKNNNIIRSVAISAAVFALVAAASTIVAYIIVTRPPSTPAEFTGFVPPDCTIFPCLPPNGTTKIISDNVAGTKGLRFTSTDVTLGSPIGIDLIRVPGTGQVNSANYWMRAGQSYLSTDDNGQVTMTDDSASLDLLPENYKWLVYRIEEGWTIRKAYVIMNVITGKALARDGTSLTMADRNYTDNNQYWYFQDDASAY